MSTDVKCYIIQVIDDIEPKLIGPYATRNFRNKIARDLRKKDLEQNNSLFMMDLLDGEPCIYTFGG